MVLTSNGELYRFFSGFSNRTCLGSLSEDHRSLVERVQQGGTPAQQRSNEVPVSQFARLYGGDSDLVYGRSNLTEFWRTEHCEGHCVWTVSSARQGAGTSRTSWCTACDEKEYGTDGRGFRALLDTRHLGGAPFG